MHCCAGCREPLKLDQSLLDRYPEWQTLNAGAGRKSKLISGKGTAKPGSTTTSMHMLQQSGGSDYSQISSPAIGGATTSGLGGNLGHATAMIGNLFDMICSDVAAIDHPMCQECTDKLLDYMDHQLHQLEEDCKEYKSLSDRLDSQKQGTPGGPASSDQHLDLNSLKSELLKLQVCILFGGAWGCSISIPFAIPTRARLGVKS